MPRIKGGPHTTSKEWRDGYDNVFGEKAITSDMGTQFVMNIPLKEIGNRIDIVSKCVADVAREHVGSGVVVEIRVKPSHISQYETKVAWFTNSKVSVLDEDVSGIAFIPDENGGYYRIGRVRT